MFILIICHNIIYHFLPPFEPPFELPIEGFDGLFPLPPPEGFPVELGAFFNPLDLAITNKFKIVSISIIVLNNLRYS